VDEKDSRSSHPGPGNGQYVAVSPGTGKSHLAAALGLALVENGWRVLFTRTTDLVQKLQIARRDLALAAAIDKLDKYRHRQLGGLVLPVWWSAGMKGA
jgi:chromosomal replication initiation ATPase DnaA